MLRRLQDRELSHRASHSFKRRSGRERFSNFKIRSTHDTHDLRDAQLKLSFLRRRSKIVELVSSGDVVRHPPPYARCAVRKSVVSPLSLRSLP